MSSQFFCPYCILLLVILLLLYYLLSLFFFCRMSFEGYILKYLEEVDYPEWSLLGLLQYLEKVINYKSESLEEIINDFKHVLFAKSKNSAYLKSAQRKAE